MILEQWIEKFAGDPDVVEVDRYPTFLNNGTFFKKAVRIVWRDGTVLAGCAWPDCLEIGKHPTTITTSHWRTHTGEKTAARGPYRKASEFSHLSFKELADALNVADSKVKRAEAARDKALDQVANMREVNREVVTNLREQLQAAQEELERVKAAVRTLYPGALG